jgi:hypothetical protein
MAKGNPRMLERRRKHVVSRAMSRHKIFLNYKKRKAIVKQIQEGRSMYLEAASNTRTFHAVEIEGKEIVVLYDKRTRSLITVLPRKSWERSRNVGNVSVTSQ